MKKLFNDFKDFSRQVSWLVILSITCVVLLTLLMNFGGAGLATVVSLGLTAIVAAILSLRE
jgi:O-antigen/teichoic acid export membrane protein